MQIIGKYADIVLGAAVKEMMETMKRSEIDMDAFCGFLAYEIGDAIFLISEYGEKSPENMEKAIGQAEKLGRCAAAYYLLHKQK